MKRVTDILTSKRESNMAKQTRKELECWIARHGRDLIDEGGVLSYSSSEFRISDVDPTSVPKKHKR
jgi:hypothetical protein